MQQVLDNILASAVEAPKARYPEGYTPIGSKGSRTAKIAIVGEAPGVDEVRKGIPFVGASGHELDKMLCDAGILTKNEDGSIDNSSVYFTNVTLIRPKGNDIEEWVQRSSKRKNKGKNPTPEHWVEYRGWLVEPHVAEDARRLVEELKSLKPNIVIALGNTPFWALCKEGMQGKVGTWRGSTLLSDVVPGLKVIPAYHPAFILRQWQHRRITVQDFRRAKAASTTPSFTPPAWEFTIAPSYHQATDFLQGLLYRLEEGPVKMTNDIEGVRGRVLCIGIGVSDRQAICIPIFYEDRFWFTPEQLFIVIYLTMKVLTHKNARIINANIGFDTQFEVNDFHIYPRIHWDTMIAQNVLFPGTPMNLAYMASMYCREYRYWKDDSEEFWKVKKINNWREIWFYNCEDCARTFEVQEAQERSLVARGLLPQFKRLQDRTFPLIRKAMFRGVRVNEQRKAQMLREIEFCMAHAANRVNLLATRSLNIASPLQLHDLFYRELKLSPVLNDQGNPTCDAEALVTLVEQEPLIGPLVKWINLFRSYSTARAVCLAKTDTDGRWRCSYSLGLVETYRLSSSKNPYGRGLNLTNISGGKDVKDVEDDD